MTVTLPLNVLWPTPDLGVAVIPVKPSRYPGRDLDEIVEYDSPQEWVEREGQVWEVRWPCLNDPHHERHGRSVCKWCNGNVFLSARASLQVVPVVQSRTVAECTKTERIVHLTSAGQRVSLVDCVPGGFEVIESLSLDPLPVPGKDWVLVIRKEAT